MKKIIIGISSALLAICAVIIIVVAIQNNKKTNDIPYEYSDNIENEMDYKLQVYAESFHNGIIDENYEGKYKGNIKNKKAIADDAIVDIIPKEYFIEEGTNHYVGTDYGYYIKTSLSKDNNYSSLVFAFDIMIYNPVINYNYRFVIKPLFATKYTTSSNGFVTPSTHKVDLSIGNIEITKNFSSECFLNVGDDGYDAKKDNGLFAIETSCFQGNKRYDADIYYKKSDQYEKGNVFSNNIDDQITKHGQLIKNTKYDFDALTLNAYDFNKYIGIQTTCLNGSPYTPPTNVDINISFNILDNKDNILDNINENIEYSVYKNFNIDDNNYWDYNGSSHLQYLLTAEESGYYTINASNSYVSLGGIDISISQYEVIENNLSRLDLEDNVFYFEKGKQYIFIVYDKTHTIDDRNTKAESINKTILTLEKVNR